MAVWCKISFNYKNLNTLLFFTTSLESVMSNNLVHEPKKMMIILATVTSPGCQCLTLTFTATSPSRGGASPRGVAQATETH